MTFKLSTGGCLSELGPDNMGEGSSDETDQRWLIEIPSMICSPVAKVCLSWKRHQQLGRNL